VFSCGAARLTAKRGKFQWGSGIMIKVTRRCAAKLIGIGLGTGLGVAPQALFAQTRARVSIGTAGRGGFFYPLGTGIAAAISNHTSGIAAEAQVTGGAADNMKLLHERNIDVALAQADVAWSAAQGKLSGLSDKVPLRTLFGTVSAYMHLVTLEGLGINGVAALKSKRMSSGFAGTGTPTQTFPPL